MDKKVAVVVPAHNEELLITRAVQQIPEYIDEIIVVDDASSDGTWNALQTSCTRQYIHCLRHSENKGVGGAILTGYQTAREMGVDIVAVMAGDAQMDPEDLPELLYPIATGRADYTKGDRLSWPDAIHKMPLERFVANHILSRLTRYTSGYREVRDSQCGYTAIDTRMIGRLKFDEIYHRYGFPNDLLAHLHSLGARLAQVPVRPVYGAERSGISLFEASFKVPRVLFRSYRDRRKRENLPRQLERGGAVAACNLKRQ